MAETATYLATGRENYSAANGEMALAVARRKLPPKDLLDVIK